MLHLAIFELRGDKINKRISVYIKDFFKTYPHDKDSTLVINGREIRSNHSAGKIDGLMMRWVYGHEKKFY